MKKCECGKEAVGVIRVLFGHKYVCRECGEKSGYYVDYNKEYISPVKEPRREKYPKDRKLRKALYVVLSRKNYRHSYISLLLGFSVYSLDSMERHFLFEHHDSELNKVYCDDAFRKKEVSKYLEQYKVEIDQFLLAINGKKEMQK